MELESLCKYLELCAYIATILGVPTAIFVYLREQRMQREEREYGTYDALDDKYIELQQLCLNHPDLDVFDTPITSQVDLSDEQKQQEEAILLIRISIFERAFLMYQRCGNCSRDNQWEGWEIEIKEWLLRGNFLQIWTAHKEYFDKSFVSYFDNTI